MVCYTSRLWVQERGGFSCFRIYTFTRRSNFLTRSQDCNRKGQEHGINIEHRSLVLFVSTLVLELERKRSFNPPV